MAFCLFLAPDAGLFLRRYFWGKRQEPLSQEATRQRHACCCAGWTRQTRAGLQPGHVAGDRFVSFPANQQSRNRDTRHRIGGGLVVSGVRRHQKGWGWAFVH